MNTIDWDKIKTALNADIKLEDKMFIIPMSYIDALYSMLKSEAMKDAIPIEWIKEFSKKQKRGNYRDFIDFMITYWERENGLS